MALVISRVPNEAFWIGDNIRVVIASVRGQKVRLAIEAPKDVPVHREEVRKRIQREEAGE